MYTTDFTMYCSSLCGYIIQYCLLDPISILLKKFQENILNTKNFSTNHRNIKTAGTRKYIGYRYIVYDIHFTFKLYAYLIYHLNTFRSRKQDVCSKIFSLLAGENCEYTQTFIVTESCEKPNNQTYLSHFHTCLMRCPCPLPHIYRKKKHLQNIVHCA